MIFCGLICSGKSTVGQAVAKQLLLPFYDTDQIMEKDQKMPVYEIRRKLGEKGFRELESAVVHSLNKEPSVIAIGGGTLLCEQNRKYLKQLSRAIYLKVPISLLWKRLEKRGISIYLDRKNPKEHLEVLAKERIPLLEAFCDFCIENYTLPC